MHVSTGGIEPAADVLTDHPDDATLADLPASKERDVKRVSASRLHILMEERQLIARVLQGDATAERELYDAHVDRVFRLIFRLSGDHELAQECTQETFIRAFDRLSTFRGESALGTWLHSIAVSVSLNALRRTRRQENRETDLEESVSSTDGFHISEPDLRERLGNAVNALPHGYRTVFIMHDVEGYTHEEIGTALGISAGTSKAQLFRARGKLRRALKEFDGEWVR